MELIQAIAERFGAHRVEKKANPLHPEQELLFIAIEAAVPVTVVSTASLSNYRMPVSEKWKGREYNEIAFVVPSYWDFNDLDNLNFNWIFSWLFRLESFVREKQTWFGPGHTIPAGNPPLAISHTMKHDHFIFLDPIFLESYMEPFVVGEDDEKHLVHFLSIVPIYPDEVDYKMGKSTFHLIKKMRARNFDERLDDYRPSFLKSRLRFW